MGFLHFDPVSWLRNALGAGGIYLLAGAGAVTFWRATDASPGAGGLVFWLLVVPTVLLLAVVGLRRWRAARRESAAQADTPPLATVASTDAAIATGPASLPPLQVTAAAWWLTIGRDRFAVVDALRRHQRPGLHATLRDLRGFPVTVAAVDDVDGADADWDIASGTAVDDSQRRALALLRPVAEDLLLAALPPDTADANDGPMVADAGPAMHPYAMHHSQSARAPAAQQRATLRMVLQVSADWSEAAREHATARLRSLAESLGHDPDRIESQCLAVHREVDTWQWLAQQASVLHDSPMTDDRLLVLATDSRVSESHVERLHGEDLLLRAGVPEGEVPGEGAAGLLLAAARHPDGAAGAAYNATPAATEHVESFDAGDDAPVVHLHAAQIARVGAEARPRDAARTSGELIARALELSGGDATSPLQVITGADHRPSRMTEAATALVAQRPDLDPVEDALHLGVACGALGVAGPLALLALAAVQARDTATPTLAYSLADATTRAVAVLSPVVPVSHPPADITSAA